MDNISLSAAPIYLDISSINWTWQMYLLSFFLSLITVSSLVTNLFVVYTFVSLSRKSPSAYGIFNLAVADFLVSIFVLPFLAIHQVTHRWYFGQTLCTLWICTHFTLCAASVLSTLFICIERFIGVSYPIHHMRILTKKRLLKCLLSVWTVAAIPSLIRVFILHEPMEDSPDMLTCRTTHNLANAVIASVLVLYIPSLIMIYLYSRIFCIASSHLSGIERGFLDGPKGTSWKIRVHSIPKEEERKKHSPISENGKKNSNENIEKFVLVENHSNNKSMALHTVDSETGNCGELRMPLSHKSISVESSLMDNSTGVSSCLALRQIRLAKKLLVLVGVILITYIPYFTAILLQAVDMNYVRDDVFRSLTWIRYFTTSVNPFIYAFAMPCFRLGFVSASFSSSRGNNNSSKPQG